MKTSHTLSLLSATGVLLALSACGGGSETAAAIPLTPVVTTISQAAVVQYMNSSIAATSEATDSADISTTALATDETSEPAPI